MSSKQIIVLSILGVLGVLTVFFFVGMQVFENHPDPFEDSAIQTSDEIVQRYEGIIVSVSMDYDLLHILENEQGLIALRVPLEVRQELIGLKEGDEVVVSGAMNRESDQNVLRLQRVISAEPGDGLSPEENVRLNSEFRSLRQ